jgi:uncharacterized protein (TIGR02996 family)
MSDHEAFVEAIADDPDDDAPRLVYADWLEERGDPHGELIRVQCALATMGKDDPRREELQPRERQLVTIVRRAWPLGDTHARPLRIVRFRRGFIDLATADVRAFPRHVDLWTRMAPTLGLTLSYSPVVSPATLRDRDWLLHPSDYAALAACPRLDRCTALTLRGRMATAGVRAILSSPHLVRLRWLTLLGIPFGAGHLAAIAASPAFDRLTHLDVNTPEAARGSPRGLVALAASPRLAGLTSLSYRNPITAESARALADSPHLANLAELVLEDSLVDEDARRIVQERFGDRVRFEDDIPF